MEPFGNFEPFRTSKKFPLKDLSCFFVLKWNHNLCVVYFLCPTVLESKHVSEVFLNRLFEPFLLNHFVFSTVVGSQN